MTDFAKKTALEAGAELVGFTSHGDEQIVVLGYPGNGCIDLLELDRLAEGVAGKFEKHGYSSRVISSHDGGVSLRMLAEDAGLGFVGRSGLLITAAFGARVRLSAVATTAPLAVNEDHSAADGCMGCRICEDACPSKAIKHKSVEMCRAHVDPPAEDRCTICVDVCPYPR